VILAAEWEQEDREREGDAALRQLRVAPEARRRLLRDEGKKRMALLFRQKQPVALIEVFFEERAQATLDGALIRALARSPRARRKSRARSRTCSSACRPGAAACARAAARRARLLAGRLVPVLWPGQLDPRHLSGNEAGRGARAGPLRADRAGLMGALLAALIAAAAAMPVLQATQAPQLVAKAAGNKTRPAVLHFWATWCEACRDEFLRSGPDC